MPFRQQSGCPHCGDSFDQVRTQNYSYRRCPTCLGVWINWSVLEELCEEMMPGQTLQIEGQHGQRQRPCLLCRTEMARGWLFGVPVDHCDTARHGIWLDKDELMQILERVNPNEDTQPPSPPTSFTSLLSDFFRS